MSKGFLAIEITASKIRYTYLKREGRGYKVLKSGIFPHSFNVISTGDLAKSLQELIKKEQIVPVRLFVTLCLADNFIRQVHMPKMNLREME